MKMRPTVLVSLNDEQVPETATALAEPFKHSGDLATRRRREAPKLEFGPLLTRYSAGTQKIGGQFMPEAVFWCYRQGPEPRSTSDGTLIDCTSSPKPASMEQTLLTLPAPSRNSDRQDRACLH